MKNKIMILTFALALPMLSIISCSKKESDSQPTPNKSSTPYQIVFNGTTYTFSDQIKLPNLGAKAQDSTFPISSNGSFISFTFDTTYTNVNPNIKQYGIAIYSVNIVNKDTLQSGLTISSTSPITTGSYAAYGTDNPPNSLVNVAYFDGTDYPPATYMESISTGTVTITSLDNTKNIVNGTFTIKEMGKKGSIPATNTVTGTFTNLPFQNFVK
jgi:hypothetical protein